MSDCPFCRNRGTGRCNKKRQRTPDFSCNSFSDSNDLLFCVHEYYKMHRKQVPEGYKAQWLVDHELSFAYLLADHKSRGTLNKASIVKTILPKICKQLHEEFGLSLTVAQLTSKYYSLKHLARLYNNLVTNETGMEKDIGVEEYTSLQKRNPAWSVDNCMKALDELGQLPPVCVARAMDKFNKESVREIFMCGTKGQRTAWVMNLGGKNRAGDDNSA